MKVMTSITAAGLAAAGTTAASLEAAGYDMVSTQENKHDPFLPLAVAASTTERIGLVTNVAIAFPRSPMQAANVAWDLQGSSNGRFVLGLGSQIKPHIQRRFSTEWRAPAAKMREYVESIKAIFDCWTTGERLSYEGDHYTFTLMTPNFVPEPMDVPPPPIHIAAVGPMMLKVAGAVCDGVTLHPFSTAEYVDTAILPRLQVGLDESGKSRDDFFIKGGGFVATGPTDEVVAKRMEWVRMRIGFYGSTPAYWPVFEMHGYEEIGPKLNAMSKKGEWDAMTSEITDDMVQPFCVTARHDQLASALAERYGGRADGISLDADLPPGLIQDIQEI